MSEPAAAPPRFSRLLWGPGWIPIALALVWRYVSHSIMLLLSLLMEGRPAPSLPDTVLDRLPRVAWIADSNYWLWLLCFIPVALALWRRDRTAFLHFVYLGGIVSVVRGICVGLTGLGPVTGPDVNAGLHGLGVLRAWLILVNPFSTLFGNAAQIYLTKDLFFSGHVSSTFLLWLYCRREAPWLRRAAALGHWATVAVVLLSRLHYTIDVVGAWAITYSLFALWGPERAASKRRERLNEQIEEGLSQLDRGEGMDGERILQSQWEKSRKRHEAQ
ncbi:MAG TPA: phosphatase PAP2-related protein [Thermoanaerobaculia bacterium]|nr:phosphatase PAP2-related protein [Thermoanaerobaculia bacterium]